MSVASQFCTKLWSLCVATEKLPSQLPQAGEMRNDVEEVRYPENICADHHRFCDELVASCTVHVRYAIRRSFACFWNNRFVHRNIRILFSNLLLVINV